MSDRVQIPTSGPIPSGHAPDGPSPFAVGGGAAGGHPTPGGAPQPGEALSPGIDAYLQAQSVMAESVQTIWREWVAYSQESMQRTGQQVERLAKARTLQDVASIQSEMLREEVDRLLRSGMRISELASRAARDAAQRITDQHMDRATGRTSGEVGPSVASGGGI